MTSSARHDAWSSGDSYDIYMGRWSRRIAPRFLDWLDPPEGADWLEVGCGTGALSAAILERCAPRSLFAIDQSEAFLTRARSNVPDPRAEFQVADGRSLPVEANSRDLAVSALVLNFIPDRVGALLEMRRAVRSGGTVAFYVWDYPGGGIAFMRAFCTAATELDPTAADLTESRRFPFCTREGLIQLAQDGGLESVACDAIEVPTVFRDFDDFWRPFTLGAGPAPGYCASLDPAARERLRDQLDESLPREPDGSIPLTARAWAVRGAVS
jgi:SAM-dependent methyltransferase